MYLENSDELTTESLGPPAVYAIQTPLEPKDHECWKAPDEAIYSRGENCGVFIFIYNDTTTTNGPKPEDLICTLYYTHLCCSAESRLYSYISRIFMSLALLYTCEKFWYGGKCIWHSIRAEFFLQCTEHSVYRNVKVCWKVYRKINWWRTTPPENVSNELLIGFSFFGGNLGFCYYDGSPRTTLQDFRKKGDRTSSLRWLQELQRSCTETLGTTLGILSMFINNCVVLFKGRPILFLGSGMQLISTFFQTLWNSFFTKPRRLRRTFYRETSSPNTLRWRWVPSS